jgi:ATP phosphoribosyltransferase regulatory subunit HisZ
MRIMVSELKVDITVFAKLDDVAKRHKITDEEWSDASDIRRPSISELRRLLKNKHTASSEKIGRACTASKINKLFSGLLGLVGGDEVKKELIEIINQEQDQNTRLILWAVLLQNAPQSSKDAAEGSLKLAATTIAPKKK